jgi:hypothetical protein
MIQLDSGFATVEAKEPAQYSKPPAGGYPLVVVTISEKPSKAGNDMVTLGLDIASGPFEGSFEKFPKMFFQLVNGDQQAYFKHMLKSFKESNSPEKMAQVIVKQRDESMVFDANKLFGCVIGGNLRDAEYLDAQGNLCIGIEVGALCSIKDIDKVSIMPIKKLKAQRPASAHTNHAANEDSGDLPF